MVRGVCLSLGALLLAGAALADSSYKPPEIGTQITWKVPAGEDGRDKRVSKVVARGDDFAIYLYDLYDDENDPLSYFAEFSGMHVTSCGYQMPSKEERENLRRFWPLQAGSSLKIGSEDTVLTTYQVGQRTTHIVSQIDGERPAQYVTAIDGDIQTDVMVSLDWGTSVLFGWNNGENARAIEMFSPIVPEAPANPGALGECAQLLVE
jgi:hypothetical protein